MEKNDRTFGDVFRDGLDVLVDGVGNAFDIVADRFVERTSERSEGPAELANPATVTQPVNRSQLPTGQALVPAGGGLNVPPVLLIIATVALVGTGVLLARAL